MVACGSNREAGAAVATVLAFREMSRGTPSKSGEFREMLRELPQYFSELTEAGGWANYVAQPGHDFKNCPRVEK